MMRRNDAECIKGHLDDTLWLRRAHSVGPGPRGHRFGAGTGPRSGSEPLGLPSARPASRLPPPASRLAPGGEPVGYVRSGAYGHTLGGAMGFGYVEHADGVTAELVRSGGFEILVAGERCTARASLRSMYDPTNERVRM